MWALKWLNQKQNPESMIALFFSCEWKPVKHILKRANFSLPSLPTSLLFYSHNSVSWWYIENVFSFSLSMLSIFFCWQYNYNLPYYFYKVKTHNCNTTAKEHFLLTKNAILSTKQFKKCLTLFCEKSWDDDLESHIQNHADQKCSFWLF